MESKSLKEKTAYGLLWGGINNLSTQLIGLVIGVILGRLLSPAEYGMVGMLAIFSAVAGTLQESGFVAAIANLKNATHREYNAVFWFSTCVSLFMYSLFFVCAPLIAEFFHQPELVPLSRLVFASFVIAGIGTAHAAYMFRNMMNREKAIIGMIALILSGLVGVALAFKGYSYWSLAWQQLIYIAVINAGRIYYVKWFPSLHFDLSPLREMFGFSSKLLVTNTINQINNNLLSVIFGRLFTDKDVGNYSQGAKWNSMGYSLISGSIMQVAQPVLASVKDERERKLAVFRKMLRFAAFISMPSMFGLALIADFVPLLLGNQWIESVTLLRILCISGAFMPIHTLYQNLFISHGRSDIYMWCTIGQIVLQLSVILAFGKFGINIMVTAYSTMLVMWIGIWQIMAKKLIGIKFVDVLKDICPFMFIALACVGIAYAVSMEITNTVVSLIVRGIVTALLYILVMKAAKVKIFDECFKFIFKRNEIVDRKN